jgi:radical SAM-linked protein
MCAIAFRKHHNIRITWTDWNEAQLEAFYGRGDRSQSKLIYEAYQRGSIFESDSSMLRCDIWHDIWKESNFDEESLYLDRLLDEVFPWDFIHAGVGKGYLKNEYKKMFLSDSNAVPDCKWSKDSCQSCGIPGNYLDTKLASEPNIKAPSRSPEEIRELIHQRKVRERSIYNYHVVFQKQGLSRFLPHQNTMNLLERAFGRLRIEVNHSQGFNPKPKISNQGALPLGLESLCEEITIEILQTLELSDFEQKKSLIDELNLIFPNGLKIIDLIESDQRKVRHPLASEYRFYGKWLPQCIEKYKQGILPPVLNHKGKFVEIQSELLDVKMGMEQELCVWAKINVSGNTVSPYLIFSSLLEISLEECRKIKIVKFANDYGEKYGIKCERRDSQEIGIQ